MALPWSNYLLGPKLKNCATGLGRADIFYKGAYGQNVALGESNAEIGLTSATTTLCLFCVYGHR